MKQTSLRSKPRNILIFGRLRVCWLLITLSSILSAPEVIAESPVTALQWSESDGRLLALRGCSLQVLASAPLTVLQELPLTLDHCHCLRLSPSSNQLVIAGGSPSESGAVQIWNYPALTKQLDVTPHTDVVQSVSWDREGSRVATASWDRTCRILDLQGNTEQVYVGHSNVVQDILFLPDSIQVASCSIDHSIQIWNRETGQTIKNLPNHTASVDALGLFSDANALPTLRLSSISQDRTLRFWQPSTGRMIRFHRFDDVPSVSQWRSDGRHIDVVCRSGDLYCVEFESLQVKSLGISNIGHVYAMTRDKDSKRLWIGGERGIQEIPLAD